MAAATTSSDVGNTLAKRVLVWQILVAALASGLLGFLVVVGVIQANRRPDQIGAPRPAWDDDQPAQAQAAPPPAGLMGLSPLSMVALIIVPLQISLGLAMPMMIGSAIRRTLAREIRGGSTAGENRELSPQQESRLLDAYQASTIIGAALPEGAGFVAGVAYMFDGNPILLGGAFLSLLAVLLRFPWQSRVQYWLNWQKEQLTTELAMLRDFPMEKQF
ncbi:MAG: hypothetical protein SFX18_18305 [Pirellulales bacterium]|nr:hypothetical protein [Pirellulales bacterium]